MTRFGPTFRLIRDIVDRFPRVASLYRGMRDRLRGTVRPRSTPWGFILAGNPLMAKGLFEPAETKLVRDLLGEMDTMINIGANIGYYCCHALSKGVAIIAFEPVHDNLKFLYDNIRINGWQNVEIFPLALSDHTGVTRIYGGGTGASLLKGWAGYLGNRSTTVPCSTMDLVLGSRMAARRVLILIDVEGSEYQTLKGASVMLANEPKPVWIVEISTDEHQPAGVEMNPNLANTFDVFFSRGYEAYALGESLRKVTAEDVALAAVRKTSLGSHNFLFRPSPAR
jgi:FkbM family methyltransferase